MAPADDEAVVDKLLARARELAEIPLGLGRHRATAMTTVVPGAEAQGRRAR